MSDREGSPPLLRTRLSVLMFLQFAIWGAWAPVLSNHLGDLKFEGDQIGLVYLTGALATMISPLIAGQIADRYFATQKFIGASFVVSGVFFYLASRVDTFNEVWWYALAAMLFFGPTLGLANSLCFHHIKDARKDFPIIRLFGTVGWIAAGFILSMWIEATGRPMRDCLVLGALFAVLNGVYCFTLPDTPPREEAAERFALKKVLRMLKDPSFLVFTLAAYLLLVFATFYYNFAGLYFGKGGLNLGDSQIPLVMLCGQVMEILTMLILPFMLRRLGVRFTVTVGMLAWAARFFVFSVMEPVEAMVAAQVLHGICFAFAIAAAMIYIERICAPDVRGSAQSFLAFVTYGLGMFTGSMLSGYLLKHLQADFSRFWVVPGFGCVAVAIFFVLFFRARDAEAVG